MLLQIGKLAEATQVNIQTIRFYEREGLLPTPDRNSNGYRLYEQIDIDRVRFIKQAQSLGFSLYEIKQLLNLRIEPNSNCEQVRHQAEEKIAQMRTKISELMNIVQTLESLVEDCTKKKLTGICPILKTIESGPDVIT